MLLMQWLLCVISMEFVDLSSTRLHSCLETEVSQAPCTIFCHSVCLSTWKISPSLTFPSCLLFVHLNWQSSITLKLPMQHKADSSAEKHLCRADQQSRGAAWRKHGSYLYGNCQNYPEADEQKQGIQSCRTREMEMGFKLWPGWNANSPWWLRTINVGKLPQEGQGDTLQHRDETAKYFLAVLLFFEETENKRR